MATHALGQSLRKALATAAELGADGVEIDEVREKTEATLIE